MNNSEISLLVKRMGKKSLDDNARAPYRANLFDCRKNSFKKMRKRIILRFKRRKRLLLSEFCKRNGIQRILKMHVIVTKKYNIENRSNS